MLYYVAKRSEPFNILIHYGTKRHSGRYPYGSGERPYQDATRRSFSYRVGEKRLKRRREILSDTNDRYAIQPGLNNNFKSLNIEQLNKQTKDILEEPDRVERIGKGTVKLRAAAWGGAGAASAGLMAISAMALDTITFGAAGALVPLGMAYIYHRKTTY